jgi:c-di-AMP phosphodiesterase-like protein
MGIIWLKKHLQYYIKLKKSKHNNLLIIKYMDLQKDLNILLANVIIQMGMAVDKELISLTLSKVTREKLISSEKSQKKSISSFSAIKNYDNIQSQISDDNKKLILELNVLYFSILDL